MKKVLFSIIKKIVKMNVGKGYYNTTFGRWAYRNFFLPLKPDYIKIEGFKLYLHKKEDIIISRGMLLNNFYEPDVTKLIKKVIKEGDVVVDGGANIGYYTILFSKLVGDKGKVYAFEPDPTNFSLLKKNVETNNSKNIILIQKAISNKTGKIKLYLDEENKGAHRIYKSDNQSIEIESVRLDDFFKNKEKIDFIKMDIEGAELDALKGASNILENNPKIIFELSLKCLEKLNIKPEILNLLESYGYKLMKLEGNLYAYKMKPFGSSYTQ